MLYSVEHWAEHWAANRCSVCFNRHTSPKTRRCPYREQVLQYTLCRSRQQSCLPLPVQKLPWAQKAPLAGRARAGHLRLDPRS